MQNSQNKLQSRISYEMNNTIIGKNGEDLAADFLQKQGYKIIERNFRTRGGEIDIIALHKDTLVYVEVKTRTSHEFGLPEESVNYFKINFLKRAANFYRLKRANKIKLPDLERIDVVAVDLSQQKTPQIRLITNIGF